MPLGTSSLIDGFPPNTLLATLPELFKQIESLRSRVFDSNGNKRVCYGFRNWTIPKFLDYSQILKGLFDMEAESFASVDVLGCVSHCHFCWVPREEEYKFSSRFYSADEIYERLSNLRGNVWRITGGEPLIVPETAFEILDRIHHYNSSKVLWLETNLLPIIAFPDIPRRLSQYERVVVHSSIKGADPETFEAVTGLEGKFHFHALQALKMLVDEHIEVFPSFVANVIEPYKLNYLFEELLEIHPKLPLRVMIREVLPYKATVSRLQKLKVALYPFQECLRVWDTLLFQEYGVRHLDIERWKITLE